jgi:RND family efflux transporter MFP subunit
MVARLGAVVGAFLVGAGYSFMAGARLGVLTPSAPTRAAYAQATSALQVAGAALEHTRQLLGEHLATRQQLEDAQKAESDARSALTALRAQGAGGPTTLRAPFAGVVTRVAAAPHALLTEGTVLLELAQSKGLALTVGVAPEDAGQIAPGNSAAVTAIGAQEPQTARVISRGALVDAASGLVPVRLALPPGAWLPGESARAVITVGNVEGFVVPHEAVLVDDDGNAYVVQDKGGIAKIVHVMVLGSGEDRDTISGPLDATAPLVVDGNYQAQEGMKLRMAADPRQASRPGEP